MKKTNRNTLILLTLMPCLFNLHAQDSRIIRKNDTIPFTNKYVSSSENYNVGLSSQLTGTSKLNTTSGILIVINGIPYPDRTSEILDFTTANLYDIAQLALIPLESIESVELLDYDASTLLYGSDARNGVISITTKKHSSTKLQVDYSFRNSFSKLPKGYEMLSGDDYTIFMRQALFNPQQNEHATNIRALLYDRSWSEYENFNNNTDWQGAITQAGINQEHYLSLSGQTNKLGYQLSAGYNKEEGTMICTSNEDFSIHLNLSYQPIKALIVTFNVNYKNIKASGYNTFGDIDLYEGALKKIPNMSVYDSEVDGTFTSEYYIPPVDPLFYEGNYTNPVHYANNSSQNKKNKLLNPTFNLEFTPIKRLNYTLATSIIKKQYDLGLYDPTVNYSHSSGFNDIGKYTNYLYKTNTLYLTNAIKYYLIQNNSNQLKLSASYTIHNREFVTEYEAFNYEGTYLAGSITDTELKKQTITGTVKYAALNRYFINLGVDNENITNNISTNSGVGYTLNTIWVASEEAIFKPINFIDELSLAASISKHKIPIPDDYCEKRQEISFNAHLQLLQRFTFNINYYEREIKDQFKESYYSRKQSILNKGIEFNTNAVVINQSNFKLTFFANLYKNTFQITEANNLLTDDFDYTNGSYSKHISLNEKYGKIYGLNYNRVYQFNNYIAGVQENAPVARDAEGNIILDTDGNPSPMTFGKVTSAKYQFQGGDAIYEDINHDGRIDKNDIQQIGNARPKITGTGGTSLQYKDWWLGFFFNFRYGNDIVNLARMDLENMYTYNNQTTAINYRWRKEGDQTDIPRALNNYGYNWLGSTRFVEDGSFFRLKTITLKYQVPEKNISKLHLSNLSLYITGKNVFTRTDYQGADPDISLNSTWDTYGYDDNYKAAIKQWIVGINVSL